MSQRKSGAPPVRAADQAMRDQEVLRANKELAAYFKGRRTEREARAALKIIKAFVRDRERRDASSRPPLPGASAAKPAKEVASRRKPRRKPHGQPRRKPREQSHERAIPEQAQLSESGDHAPR